MLRAIDRLGPAAGVMVAGLALVAALLVPLGWWRAVVVLPIAVALAMLGWRVTPGLDPGRASLVSLALALAFTMWSAVLHSEHVVIRRDGGAYALYTQWIATRHGLPVSADLAAFGGAAAFDVPRFTLTSPAFYQVLSSGAAGSGVQAEIVPQFLVGAPAVFSLGWWAGAPFDASWTGMQVVPAVLSGVALMCFAALVGRLVGPAWAPLGVAGLGLALPVVLVSRTTYSEPAALLVMLAATVLLVDAFHRGRRHLAAVGGVMLGLAGLVRVDTVREVALLVSVCALLAVRGNRVAPAVAAAALVGSGVSLAVGWMMSRPYLTSIGPSLRPLLVATVLAIAASALAVPFTRRGAARRRAAGGPQNPSRTSDVWPRLATGAVLLLGAVLVSRPMWLTVRQDAEDPGAVFVASLQRGQGLPVDGGRTYAEQSLSWAAWYLGWPAVVGAWVVFAVLAGRTITWWRSGSAHPPAWLTPAVVGFGSAVLLLLRPGITPDHPWADRRLVPVLLPLVVVAAVAGIASATGHLRRRMPRLPTPAAVAACAVLLLMPAAWATAPLAGVRTEAGEVGAVQEVCEALKPGDVVAAVDATAKGVAQRSGNEWVQVVRGICGRPSAALPTPGDRLPVAAASLADLVAGAGGRLVLLTAQEDGEEAKRVLSAAGAGTGDGVPGGAPRFAPPQRAVRLETLEDRKLLTRRPQGPARLVIDVWLAPART